MAVICAMFAGLPLAGGGAATNTVQAAGRSCGGTTGASIPTGSVVHAATLRPATFQPAAVPEPIAQASETPVAPAQAGDSKTWAGQADFLPGSFEHTEIITGSQAIALDRVWTPNQQIGAAGLPATIPQDQPSLTALGNTVYSAWRQTRSGDADIFFAPAGVAGVAPRRINDDTGTAAQEYPTIIGQGTSTLLALWQDSRSGNPDIISARSIDGGVTWEANARVSSERGTAPQTRPSVVAGSIGGFCSCWLDSRSGKPEVYFSRSVDGITWGTNGRVSDPASLAQGAPRIAVGPNAELYVVWEDTRNGNTDIYLATSGNGTDWSPGVRVNDDSGTGAQAAPDLAVTEEGEVVVVWRDERNGVPEVWSARSSDGAASWQPNRRIAGGVLPTALPSVAVDAGGLVFATWEAPSGGGANLQAAHSIDMGTSWFLDGAINDREGSALPGTRAGLAPTTAGPIRAAWSDSRNTTPELWSAVWPAPRLYAQGGSYTGPVLDTRGQSAWGALSWDAASATGTSLAFEVRSGDSLIPGAGWSAWLPAGAPGASLDNVPRARFIQWRALFSGPGTATPRLNSVTLTWGPVPNAPPRARAFLPFAEK